MENITKRDYIATLAMQGILVNRDWVNAQNVAELAYECADAMIKESEKSLSSKK